MIPKKIHYCWFGCGEKPRLAKKCIASWKKYCPGYEIIEWNEDNFDIRVNEYTAWCYENHKYAFLSDYVRLAVVEKYGGIYFDTDVEVLRRLDQLLENSAFFGFENDTHVATGLGFGAEAHHPILRQMLREYEPLLDGQHGTIMCPELNTNALIKFGLHLNGQMQRLDNDIFVYPADYFNPYDSLTGRLNKTKNTYSIHWYSGFCLTRKQRIRSAISKPLHRIFGNDFMKVFRK